MRGRGLRWKCSISKVKKKKKRLECQCFDADTGRGHGPSGWVYDSSVWVSGVEW